MQMRAAVERRPCLVASSRCATHWSSHTLERALVHTYVARAVARHVAVSSEGGATSGKHRAMSMAAREAWMEMEPRPVLLPRQSWRPTR